MAQIGDIQMGCEIGKTPQHAFIWHACEGCGKERWVNLVRRQPEYVRCLSCACYSKGKYGKNHLNWRGGRSISKMGYVVVKLTPDDFFYPMTVQRGTVFEHRLVMAKHLNRCLLPWEVVHHKNGNRADNRLENLQTMSQIQHVVTILFRKEVNKLKRKVERKSVV